MFINISNHHSSKWSKKQIEAALKLGNCNEIINLGFPNVDPHWDRDQLFDEAIVWFDKIRDIVKENIRDIVKENSCIIHLMGETGFVCRLGIELDFEGFDIVHSTTERIVEEKDGQKISTFKFVQFRRTF